MKVVSKLLIFLMSIFYSITSYGDVKMYNDAERKQKFQKLWAEIEKNHIPLYQWQKKWTTEELKIQFEKMQQGRAKIYFSDPENFGKGNTLCKWKNIFNMPKIDKSWGSRYLYPMTFGYTLAHPQYNASIITLRGINFIAMEAPTNKNLDRFFHILDNYKVTDLIRLTPQNYDGRENSVPYWDGRMDINVVDGRTSININNKVINYFPVDTWKDHHGIDAKKLIGLIKAVKRTAIDRPKKIAVHCRAGVGRTGTFIIAYTLLECIDKQIADGIKIEDLKINIDQIIWELSLQRPFSVTHFPQYLSLYKVVDEYLRTI